MAHKQHPLKPKGRADVQRIADEVGAGDHRPGGGMGRQKIFPVMAGRQHQRSSPGGGLLAAFHLNGVHQGGKALRLHNAAGAQNGNAPLNAQPGVEGVGGGLGPARHADGHGQPAGVARLFCGGPNGLGDHAAGHLVDGGSPHRLFQPGQGDPPHALAAVQRDGMALGARHQGLNGQAVGSVGVIPGVFFHLAQGKALAPGQRLYRGGHLQPGGGQQRFGGRGMARQQQAGGRRRCQGGTGAGGVTAAQSF